MEVYDAQMLDIPSDLDVHMHTNFSSPKPWIESSMDDDTDVLASENAYPEDVEVDMEQAYEDGVEYEMADEGDEVVATGVTDVDFVDAHHSFEPSLGFVTTAPLPVEHVMSEHPPESGSTPHDNAGYGGLTGEAILLQATDVHPLEHHDELAEHTTTTRTEPAIIVENLVSAGPSHISLEDAEPEPFDAPAEGLHVESSHEADHAGDVKTYDEPDQVSRQENGHEGHEEPSAGSFEEASGEANVDADAWAYEEAGEPQSNGVDEYQAPGAGDVGHVLEEDYYESGGDPLEISDGVYIEPPPAVLLDLPSSSDQLECCLFNTPKPNEDSRSQTPTSPHFTVLLQSQPTLYYEPISEVFSALRLEERVHRISEFQEGELILDAFELGLVLSEDNVHAREVTLHDINSLHDGSDLSGPLRIRLRCSPYRFVTRYHALREQVHRLALADSGTTINEEPPPFSSVEAETGIGSKATEPEDSDETPVGGEPVPDSSDHPEGSVRESEEGHPGRETRQPITPQLIEGEASADISHAHENFDRSLEDERVEEPSAPVAHIVEQNAETSSVLDSDAVHSDSNKALTQPETEYLDVVQEQQETVDEEGEELQVPHNGVAAEDALEEDDDEKTLEDDEPVESLGDEVNNVDAAISGNDPQDDLLVPADDDNAELSNTVEEPIPDQSRIQDVSKSSENGSSDHASNIYTEEPLLENPDDDTNEWELDAEGETDWDETSVDGLVELNPEMNASETSLKRRFDDLEDITEVGFSAQERRSLSPDSKRSRVE